MARFFLAVVLLSCIVATCLGHSYLTKPTPRNGSRAGCRIGGPPQFNPIYCPGPCQVNYSPNQPTTTAARGSDMRVEWPRNNHPGGFIRLAWVRSEESDNNHELFDGNVQQYSCHEFGCQADAGPGNDGGDSNPSDGSSGACYTDITIPLHLDDGTWTLQWAWYGASGGYLGDYYSCANFIIQGGPTGPQLEPVFQGGDVSNPGTNVCEYWTTDRLHQCVSEPCGEICDSSFKPDDLGCGQRRNGVPYIDPLINVVPPTKPDTPPKPDPIEPEFKIVVLVSVSLNIDSRVFDPVIFIYDVTDLLSIPAAAISKVEINLDKSNNQMTFLTFNLENALDADGVPISPLQKANELKEFAASGNPILSGQYNLNGLAVLGADEVTPSTATSVIPASFAVFCATLFAML